MRLRIGAEDNARLRREDDIPKPLVVRTRGGWGEHLEDTGLRMSVLSDIVLKYLYYSGNSTGLEVADQMCLPWPGVVEKVVDFRVRRGAL